MSEEPPILELLKKANKVTVAPRKPRPTNDLLKIRRQQKEITKQTQLAKMVHESLRGLKEQIAQIGLVDLSTVLERLANMENQLVLFNEHWQKRVEMYDLQMSILQKFDVILAKEKNK